MLIWVLSPVYKLCKEGLHFNFFFFKNLTQSTLGEKGSGAFSGLPAFKS